MLDCRGIRDSLGRYFDGELPAPERRKIEDHLKRCSQCRAALQEIKEIAAIFKKDMQVSSPPKNLTRMIMEKAQAEVESTFPGWSFLLFWRSWSLSMRFAALGVAVAACYIGIIIGSSSLTASNEMKWVDMTSRGPIVTAYEGNAR
jgi:anti-sigma factor RsiW